MGFFGSGAALRTYQDVQWSPVDRIFIPYLGLKFALQMWKYFAYEDWFSFYILVRERHYRFIDFQTTMVDIGQCTVLNIPVQCTSLYCTAHYTSLHCSALHIILWYCTADYTLAHCTFYTAQEMEKNVPACQQCLCKFFPSLFKMRAKF